MTIIAYRDGVIAADTLVVGGEDLGYRVGYGPKLHRIKGGVVAYHGCTAASRAVRLWLENGAEGDVPSSEAGGVVWFPDHGTPEDIMDGRRHPIDFDAPYLAWGCGDVFALAAMFVGADAVRAVECAIALSTSCGGTVQSMRHATKGAA